MKRILFALLISIISLGNISCKAQDNIAWVQNDVAYENINYGALYNFWAATNPASVEYGYLYNWYAATDSRNICGIGFHVPTSSEVTTLRTYLSPNPGLKLKETGFVYWNSPNAGATNESSFNARGAGERIFNTGLFSNIKSYLYLWESLGTCNYSQIDYSSGDFIAYSSSTLGRTKGLSIRLIKDFTTLTHGQTGTYTGNDGRIYPTICIGTQEWVSVNLMETKYRNGDAIPEVTDNTAWAALTTGARCSYNNTLSNAGTGNAITSSNDWAVPNYTDLNYNQTNSLFYYLGGATAYSGKLKEIGLTYWDSPNTGATNELGFNARGGGYRIGADGSFLDIKKTLLIHSKFESSSDSRQYAIAKYDLDAQINMSGGWSSKKNGCSIRLLYVGTGTPSNYVGNDGKVYRIVQIGTQWWLADNLAETLYRDGSTIPVVIDNTAWSALTTGARCVYDNNESNK